MKTLMLALALIGAPIPAFAHEGHDHDAPAMVQAPKGGVIKSVENVHVEVVSKGKELKIYLYNKDLKPQSVTGFVISAKAEFPRTKKTEDVALAAQDTFYTGTFDAKGAHRYTLAISLKDPKESHADKINFTIEPRK